MISALIFDFDGTILDTEAAEIDAVRSVFSAHGAELNITQWQHVVGTDADEGFWVPWLESESGPVDHRQVVADAKAMKHALLREMAPLPGVVDLLDAARAASVPVGIASSSPARWVEPLIERLGLRHHFTIIRCRDHVARAKPHPDLYVAACDGLAALPGGAVAVEDSRNGALAAKAAGLYCVVCPNSTTHGQDLDHADRIVESLAELATDFAGFVTATHSARARSLRSPQLRTHQRKETDWR